MTPEQQRIAIAEACGFNDPHWECPRCGRVESTHVTYEERHGIDGCLQFVHWVDTPDYLNDLNAMHEAEKSRIYVGEETDSDIINIYIGELLIATPAGRSQHATAAQRAEAFLRTLNLWTNETNVA